MPKQTDLKTQVAELKTWCQNTVTSDFPSFNSDEEAYGYLYQLAVAFDAFYKLAVDQDTVTLIEKPISELNGLTPLEYAAAYGFTQVLKNIQQDALLSDRAPNGRNLLHFAAANASLTSTRYLLTQGLSPITPDNDGNRPFHLALKLSALEDSAIFTDIRTSIFTALTENLDKSELEACNNAHENIVHIMATYGIYSILDTLIQEKSLLLAAQTETDKQTPLHRAILNKHDAIALTLIRNKQGINTPDAGSNTPLHLAYEEDNQKLIDELIKQGAHTNVLNSDGKTPQAVGDDIKKSESVGVMR